MWPLALLMGVLLSCTTAAAARRAFINKPPLKPHCIWTGLIYTPYVPRGDIDADDLLVQIPKNCSDKLLSDKLKRRCNACASRTTLKSCLATNAQTWHQSKDIESCTWVSYNARHETVRELNFTLGVNFPNYYISRTDPRICAVTREYTVESGPEYTASYFTSFGDVVRDDGTDLPWGLRPEAGCAVKWPETKCRLKFYQTPNISVAVSQRDMLACVGLQSGFSKNKLAAQTLLFEQGGMKQ